MIKNFKNSIFTWLVVLIEQIFSLKSNIRILILILFDSLLIIFSLFISSILLSTDNLFYFSFSNYTLLLTLVILSIPINLFTGQYKDLTRFIGSKSLYNIVLRNFIIVFFTYLIISIPLSLAFVIWTFISFISYTSRIILRDIILHLNDRKNLDSGVLIYGAGAAGARLVNILKQENKFFVKAFVDDNPSLWGRSILGIKIFSPTKIQELKQNKNIGKILLAIPTLSKDNLKRILNNLSNFNINVMQIPNLTDIINGKSKINYLKPINFEDLLGRDVVNPKYELLEKEINNSIVLITGAGGSIGSQLCRELCPFNPKKIILFDISEPSLYSIHHEFINSKFKNIEFIPILGNATDFRLVENVISQNAVDIIFHAAAYKHVPLVEMNPLQSVNNNIISTKVLCECAKKYNVEKLVLISSDKAVRPTSLMGVSKRISELIVQASQESFEMKNSSENRRTIFSMVRFGNVINSSGSVIPLFQKQIKNGGPITLTHEEITRYFMTLEEASQLVIQSSSLAKGGELFLLDMGKPVKIKKIAEQMISLSGLTLKDSSNPNGDIEIIISGLRPGEKLFEELLIENNSLPTEHPLIFKAEEDYIKYSNLKPLLDELESSCFNQDLPKSFELIKQLVPEWKPSK